MNHTLAPGRHHLVHSLWNALPPVPASRLWVIGILLVAAVLIAIIVAHALTGAPYVHGLNAGDPAGDQAAAAPDAAEVLR